MHKVTTFHPLFRGEFGFLLQHLRISHTTFSASPIPLRTPQCSMVKHAWINRIFYCNNRNNYAAASTSSFSVLDNYQLNCFKSTTLELMRTDIRIHIIKQVEGFKQIKLMRLLTNNLPISYTKLECLPRSASTM